MDPQTHLKRLGWQGQGLGRQQNGIQKPLLISHKQNVLGVGSKTLKEKQADQWWLRAFDSALKDFGTGNTTTLNQVSKLGVSKGGLYGFFVKGEGLAGTWQESKIASTSSQESSAEPVTLSTTTLISETMGLKDLKSKKRKRTEDGVAKVEAKLYKKMKKGAAPNEPSDKPKVKRKSPREERRALRKLQKQQQRELEATAKGEAGAENGVATGVNSLEAQPQTNGTEPLNITPKKVKVPKSSATPNVNGYSGPINGTMVLERLRTRQPPFEPGDLDAALIERANGLNRSRLERLAKKSTRKGKPLETLVRREINKWSNIAKRKQRKLAKKADKKKEKEKKKAE